MDKWQAFIENYGFRGPKELDIATPRYYEKTGELFKLLKTMEGYDDPEINPQTIFDRGAQQRVESVRFLEEYLSKTPGKLKAFKKNYRLVANFGAYRESPKYYIIMVIDYLRRRALALGAEWVEAGRLDSIDQVFDLHLDEFIRAETDAFLDIRSRANDNREYYAQFNPDNDPPIVIDFAALSPNYPYGRGKRMSWWAPRSPQGLSADL